MSELVFRPAVAGDAEFLEDMLVEAANAPDRVRGRAETLAEPEVARYIEGWPRATDLGVVATDADDRPIGAVWLRYFSPAAPAYGFVRADIPELAIGVAPGQRGRGVGRALMRAAEEAARRNGVAAISLSVERTNPAWSLYHSEGYRVVSSRPHADTMLLDLRLP